MMGVLSGMFEGPELTERLDKALTLLSRIAHAQESLAETERARLIVEQGRTTAARLIAEAREHEGWVTSAKRTKENLDNRAPEFG